MARLSAGRWPALISAALCVGQVLPGQASQAPAIRQVITLLEEMKAQVEKDASADQKSYDKYMCWCGTNDREKTEAIEIAEQRIEAHTAFIEESAGRAGELKTQIAGLASDIAADNDALATAKSVREEEQESFLAAEADMKETRSLLQDAMATLSKVQLLQKQGKGAEHVQEETAALIQVRNFVQQRFPKFQGVMQRDLFDVLGSLQEEAPVPEHRAGAFLGGISRKGAALDQTQLLPWEKTEEQMGIERKPNDLEGQASGAKSYNSRSGKILGILEEMHDQFTRDLATAQKDDFEAEVMYQKLRAAKLAEIAAASEQKSQKEASLADTLDKSAKAKEMKESTEEAMSADQVFLVNLKKNCKNEDEEYKSRAKVRTDELVALAEALKILTDDDARDLYAKTVSFVQVGTMQGSAAKDRAVHRAVQRIAELAQRNKNAALASLAVHMRLDSFTEVKAMMDKMVADLMKQQKDEYDKVEQCKKDLDRTEDEIKQGNNVKEDLDMKHRALSDTIATLEDEIAALKAGVAEMEVSLKQAGEERKTENQLYITSISDQRATTNILKKALTRLQKFYVFGQIREEGRQEPGAAAPPPPPSPKDYSKSDYAGGVLQLFEKIIKDAEVAEVQLEATEQQSQKDYAEFVQTATKTIETDRLSTEQKEALLAEANAERSETEESQLANGEELANLADLLKAYHLDCDWVMKYFDVRQKARAEEMEAIKDAKAILSGSVFDD